MERWCEVLVNDPDRKKGYLSPLTDFPPALYTSAAFALTFHSSYREGRWTVPTLRKELVSFVMVADDLITSMGKTPMSPAEQAILDFYIKEIPAKGTPGLA